MEVRDGGRWCLEDSLPMMLESERWLAAASSRRLREALPWAVMERARVCDGLCATVAPWAWARVGWVAVWELEMSWAVGSFALAFERVCALFLRPTERGRATEGEVGEAALLLLSLDCELPMLMARRRRRHRHHSPVTGVPRGQQPSLHLHLHSRALCGLSSSRLHAAHALPQRMALGVDVRQGKVAGRGESQGRAIWQSGRYDRSCRQAALRSSVPPGSNLDAPAHPAG